MSLQSTARLTAILYPLALLISACSGSGTNSGMGGSGSGAGGGSSDAGGGGNSSSSGGAAGTGGSGGSSVAPDTKPPTILSTDPLDAGMNEATTVAVSATFSEAMAPSTLTGATFLLKQGAVEIPGTVTYFDTTATFLPSSNLAVGTTYTATITTGAADLAGNALAAQHTWSFTTDKALPVGPAPVLLGASGNYVLLAKSAISNVPTSNITGNVGLSPAAASYITGFSLTKAGTSWASAQVVGSLFAADNDPPTPTNLTIAVSDMETAYTDAASRPTPMFLDLGGGAIGGTTLPPGLYKWASSVNISSDVALQGAPNDVWILQITGDLVMGAAKKMTLSGGARAKNIVWQVAGSVDLGADAHAEGIVLAKTAIKLSTGASINGRLLAQTAISLASSTVAAPAP